MNASQIATFRIAAPSPPRVRFNVVRAMVGDSAKEGSPTMARTKLSDEALLEFFRGHPELRERIESIAGAVGNSEGNLVEADAAEERLVEEMRLFGREAMQGWAEERVEATEREVRREAGMHRLGKKNSSGAPSSARSRS